MLVRDDVISKLHCCGARTLCQLGVAVVAKMTEHGPGAGD